MLFATWVTALNILVFAALVAAVIYLFVLIVRALKKYIGSKAVREEKQAVKRTLGETLKAHRTRCQMTQEFEAEALGVSRQTVSRVVNGMPNVTEKTRKRVLAAMEELGFRPNFAGAALRGGSYRSIGLCMYNITRVGNLATLEGIMQAAREHDFAVTMIEMGGDKPYTLADASRRMVERPVDGMILNMNRMAPDFEEFVPQPGVRTVILSMYAHPRCTTIDSDQYGSCELLTNYLLEHGHSNMRFVAGPENSISSRFREAGWRDTLGRAHVDAAPMLRGDWSADSGYAMGERIAAEVLADGQLCR